ncbi:hypothetical protein D3C76_1802490 [compost metagenome]
MVAAIINKPDTAPMNIAATSSTKAQPAVMPTSPASEPLMTDGASERLKRNNVYNNVTAPPEAADNIVTIAM